MKIATASDRQARTPYSHRQRAKVLQMDVGQFRRMMCDSIDETVCRCAVCGAPMDENRVICRRCEG